MSEQHEESADGSALMVASPHISGVSILIVEDSATLQMQYGEKLSTIQQAFPDAKVTKVSRLDDALAIIAKSPAPDIVLLDLTLEDSDWLNTLDHAPDIETRSALLIISVHSEEEIRQRLSSPTVTIIAKTADMWRGNFLVNLIAEIICLRRKICFDDVYKKLERVKERSIDAGTPERT